MKLYFGNAVTTATTLMTLVLLGFIGYSAHHRAAQTGGGRRVGAGRSAPRAGMAAGGRGG